MNLYHIESVENTP